MRTSQILCFMIVAGSVFCPSRVPAATTIVTDSFTGTNGSSLGGRTPDGIHLNNQTWSLAGFQPFSITTGVGNPLPSAVGSFNGTVVMNISTPTTGYFKPTDFTLSMDLRMTDVGNSGVNARGLGLGFYSTPTTFEANEHFTGLTMAPDGTLSLVIDGTEQAATAPAPAGFNINNFYNLTYSVNLTTGGITSVTFAGVDRTSTFSGAPSAGAFTNAATQFVGFYGSSSSSSGSPGFDNFSLSTQSPVPEPSSALLLLGGFSMLGLRRRLLRKS